MTDIESLVALGEGITPGPWEADNFSAVQSESGKTIALCSPDTRISSDDSLDRMRANARAIAAVPDLIAAIRTLQTEKAELRDHIAEQIKHVEARIQDGVEMGATVWRIALEDVVRENRIALSNTGEME